MRNQHSSSFAGQMIDHGFTKRMLPKLWTASGSTIDLLCKVTTIVALGDYNSWHRILVCLVLLYIGSVINLYPLHLSKESQVNSCCKFANCFGGQLTIVSNSTIDMKIYTKPQKHRDLHRVSLLDTTCIAHTSTDPGSHNHVCGHMQA